MTRTVVLWVGGILAGVGLAFAIPHLVAHVSTSQGLRTLERVASSHVPPLDSVEHLVVIGRRPERTHLEDPTPHRNSRIGLYQRGKSAWNLVRGPLPVRSHSTNPNPPIFHTREEALRRGSSRYGFQSVPEGVFTMVEIPWRNNNRAFLISDYGRTDGTITLDAPQVVVSYRAVEDSEAESGWRLDIDEQAQRSSWDKRESALHPTHTQIWSHGDSNGCINLYHPVNPDDPDFKNSDWMQFLGWLDDAGLRGEGSFPTLVIVPWEVVSGSQPDSLADTLPHDFHLMHHTAGIQ